MFKKIRIKKLLSKGLKMFSNKDVDYFNDFWDPEKKKAFLLGCFKLSKNKTLERVIDFLIKEQSENVLTKVRSWEEDLIARGTVNGLYLLKEELERMGSEHLVDHPNQKHDKYDVI